MEGRRRPRLRWDRGLRQERFHGSVREWRMRARHGGVEMVGEDGSETGLVMKKKGKQKSTTGIGSSLTLIYIVFFKCSTCSIHFLAASEREMLSSMSATQLTLDGVVQELATVWKQVKTLHSGDNHEELPEDIEFPLPSVEKVESRRSSCSTRTSKTLW